MHQEHETDIISVPTIKEEPKPKAKENEKTEKTEKHEAKSSSAKNESKPSYPPSEVEQEALHKHMQKHLNASAEVHHAFWSVNAFSGFAKVPFFADKWVEGLFFIGTFMLLTVCYRHFLGNCKCYKQLKFELFMEGFFSLYNEAITILTMLIIVQILDYYRYFSFLSANVTMICYGVGIFLILFAKVGLIYVCAANKRVKRWRRWEDQAMD